MADWDLPQLAKYTGVQIKRLREEKNWSQEELAKKLNTTKTSISNYENGKRTPRFDGLYLLSTIFEVPIDTFFPEHRETNYNQVYGANHGVNGNISGTINFGVNEETKKYQHANIKHKADDLVLQQIAADSLAQISALNTQQVDQLNTIISILKERPY